MTRIRTTIALALAVLLAGAVAPAFAAKHRSWPGTARYSVPREVLDAALECAQPVTGRGVNEPVLLVHGTGVEPEHNFAWNYWPALRLAGFELCWVRLPRAALADMQIAAEYVARAVEVMHRAGGRKIDVLGHSQGGVLPRWAIKYFPSGRFVDDYVALATPNHGTISANIAAASGETAEAIWQMRIKARFTAALNRGDETPGPISYTSIYTVGDEMVQPASSAALEGGSNILIQDVCPGRTVTHVSIVVDAAVYALVLDAFTNPGPADPSRVSGMICLMLTMEGAGPALPIFLPDWSRNVVVSREPPLKPYARRR